ncbi:MAG TPA: hypothetical protein VLL98_03705 [Rickettsiales bacterium]|nr:hypothetical protein [Rickettsiales bacterium]
MFSELKGQNPKSNKITQNEEIFLITRNEKQYKLGELIELNVGSLWECERLQGKLKSFVEKNFDKSNPNTTSGKERPNFYKLIKDNTLFGVFIDDMDIAAEEGSLIGIANIKLNTSLEDCAEKYNVKIAPTWEKIFNSCKVSHVSSLLIDTDFKGQKLCNYLTLKCFDYCKTNDNFFYFTEINPYFFPSRAELIKNASLTFDIQHKIIKTKNILEKEEEILLTQNFTILYKDLAEKMKQCLYKQTKTKFEYTEQNLETLKVGILGENKKDPLIKDDEVILWEKEVVNNKETLVPYKVKFDVEKMIRTIDEFKQIELNNKILKQKEELERLEKKLKQLEKNKRRIRRNNSCCIL